MVKIYQSKKLKIILKILLQIRYYQRHQKKYQYQNLKSSKLSSNNNYNKEDQVISTKTETINAKNLVIMKNQQRKYGIYFVHLSIIIIIITTTSKII